MSAPAESNDPIQLRRQVADLERALEAIRSGDVDALVMGGGGRVQLYQRTTADRCYKVMIEELGAAVATVSQLGLIVYANQRLAEWLHCERASLLGRPLRDLVLDADWPGLERQLADRDGSITQFPLTFRRSDATPLPVLVGLTLMEMEGEGERVHALVAIADPDAAARSQRPEPQRSRAWLRRTPAGGQRALQGTGSQKLGLVLLFALLFGLALLDRALRPESVLLPYYLVPLLLAISFARPRQMLVLALTALSLAILVGLSASQLGDADYQLQLGAVGLVGVVSLGLTVQRQRRERKRIQADRDIQLVAENSSSVVFRANVEGETQWISPSVMSLIGWEPEQLVGLPFQSFVHPDDCQQWHQAKAAFARGEHQQVRLRVRQTGGGYRWVSVNGRGAKEASGSVIGIIGSWHDIQEEVEAEQANAVMESRLKATLDSLFDAHMVLEARRDASHAILDFTVVAINQAACHYNLLSAEQLIGSSLLQLLPAHGSTGLMAIYAQTVETGQPLLLDDFAYRHDLLGDTRHFDIRAVALGEELSVTWRDMSERSEKSRLLAESEEAFRLLAQNSSDVVVRVRDDKFLWVSPSLKGALGWQPEQWISRSPLDRIHPNDLASYRTAIQAIARGENVVRRGRISAQDGTWHWVEVNAAPFRDLRDHIDGVVASFRIIDREVAAQQELEHHAHFDGLTGLLNRREVLERIDALKVPVQRTGLQTAILFCDLDRFKAINDTYGHAAGDQLLQTVTARLQGCLRREDLAARIGGDELLVVLRGVQDLDNAVAIGEKICRVVQEPVPTAAGELQISLSIGVTLALPGESSDALMARADDAMYRAKQTGRNRVVPISGSA